MELRTVGEAELQGYRDCVFNTFGDDASIDAGGEDRLRKLIPERQRWAMFDGSQVVGTAGSFDLEIGVPGGGSVRMAGLTMVTVRPTHRRRGILRDLMTRYAADARERGYAIGGLWASEAAIYGRFGFGIATQADVISIGDATAVKFRRAFTSDRFEWLEEPQARELLPAIYARATANRPGVLRRSALWWQERRFLETGWMRGGASKRRHVIARRDGEITGYLAYRQRDGFDGGLPTGKVEIIELVGIDPRAELSLWKFALEVDLFPQVKWGNAPVDDVLAWAVVDPRRVQRRRTDCMWLWIDDPVGAFAARRYEHDGVLRFAVEGATYELEVAGGVGRCTRSERAAELEIDRTALGSIYLGGVEVMQLARAGLVRGDQTAIARADQLFRSAIAPWCPEVF